MKKLFLVLSIVVGSLFIVRWASSVLAQDLTFNRAYTDYIYQMDLYNKAHSDYEVARANYLQLGTLASKDKAQGATYKMLSARDDAVKTYLTALRMRLAVADGMSSTTKNELFALLDTDVSWFMNHKENLSSAGSLDDLVTDSDKVKEHYLLTENLVYRVLTTISVGKAQALQVREGNTLRELENKIAEIKANGDKDTTNAERGALEVENKLARSQTKQDDAVDLMDKMKTVDTNKSGVYDNILNNTGQALQYLKEGGSFLAQIITNIKTQD